MQTTWDELDWYRTDKTMQKQLLVFLLSVILVVLILLIPVTVTNTLINNDESSIRVELQKTIEPQVEKEIVEPPKPEPKPIQQQPVETKPIQVQKPLDVQEPIEPVKEPTNQVPVEVETLIEPTVEQKLPSSAVILKSLYDGKPKLNTLSKEFQVRTQDPNDFIYQKVEAPKWNHVTKLIDEDVDKPQTDMKFYSIGYEGSIERFMDKITYKKTFTTKYGTKIHCAITIIIGACGWK